MEEVWRDLYDNYLSSEASEVLNTNETDFAWLEGEDMPEGLENFIHRFIQLYLEANEDSTLDKFFKKDFSLGIRYVLDFVESIDDSGISWKETANAIWSVSMGTVGSGGLPALMAIEEFDFL